MVDALRPVLEYEVAFAAVVLISVQGPEEDGALSIINPVSFVELSFQPRLIWLDDTAVAVRLLGAVGSVITDVVVLVVGATDVVVVLTEDVVVVGFIELVVVVVLTDVVVVVLGCAVVVVVD